MLTRRVFRQLTDNALFDALIVPRCLCAHTHPQWSSATRHKPYPSYPRYASSASSTRWKGRQVRDHFARDAKVQGLKSRAAFKLLEIDQKYRLFKPGQTVVDLGYAPGSWSQVAQSRTNPHGRVIGIDILPVQPPKGVSTIQGNFLSKEVRDEVRAYLQDPDRGKVKRKGLLAPRLEEDEEQAIEERLADDETGYIDMERHSDLDFSREEGIYTPSFTSGPPESLLDVDTSLDIEPLSKKATLVQRDEAAGRVVDILLSDMSAPWPQTTGMWVKSVSNVYHRLQNTSGIPFKDHVDSMDLCFAALTFGFDTLRTGGSFVCKFYAGREDKVLEGRLKKLFERVVREKPDGSRSESKEAYFVALRRKENARKEDVLH